MTCATLAGLSSAMLSWGGIDNQSHVRLRPDEGAVAVVEFRNTLTFGSPKPFYLTLGDLTVHVAIEFGPGMEPDVIEVTAPDQYLVAPPILSVAEYETGVIRILCRDAVGVG